MRIKVIVFEKDGTERDSFYAPKSTWREETKKYFDELHSITEGTYPEESYFFGSDHAGRYLVLDGWPRMDLFCCPVHDNEQDDRINSLISESLVKLEGRTEYSGLRLADVIEVLRISRSLLFYDHDYSLEEAHAAEKVLLSVVNGLLERTPFANPKQIAPSN